MTVIDALEWALQHVSLRLSDGIDPDEWIGRLNEAKAALLLAAEKPKAIFEMHALGQFRIHVGDAISPWMDYRGIAALIAADGTRYIAVSDYHSSVVPSLTVFRVEPLETAIEHATPDYADKAEWEEFEAWKAEWRKTHP